MTPINRQRCMSGLLAAAALVALAGCSGRNPADLDVARATDDPVVFEDGYDTDIYPQAFAGTDIYATTLDSVFAHAGTRSLKVTVPPQGSALGAYAGGVLTSAGARDLTAYNALTFWARSSVASNLNEVGFGNDNTGTSRYSAGRAGIPLSTAWVRVVVPIPAPQKLIAERGLFTYAEGWEAQHSAGHTLWFDQIAFAHLDSITNPRPMMVTTDKPYFVGATVSLDGCSTTFSVDGADVVVNHMPGYFDFTSSAPSVARVEGGVVKVIGAGDAEINATLAGAPVTGTVTVKGYRPPAGPPPTPTLPAASVISMYSDAYTNVPVGSWNTHWQYSTTDDSEYTVAGDVTRMYANLNFVGIDLSADTIDASRMTHLHIDVYAPAGTNFKVKLVAFDADGGHMTGQSELTFDGASTPAFIAGQWSSLDIPLADFQFAVPLDHVGQLVFSTDDASLVLVDNIYWHS